MPLSLALVPDRSPIPAGGATESPEQVAFRASVRAFLSEHAEPRTETDPWQVSGFPDDAEARAYFEHGRSWQRTLADHGWAGLCWPTEYGGEAAPQTSGVVDAVTNGTGTIGYADASRAGDLGTVAVAVGGDFVPFSPEAAAAIVDASPRVEGRGPGDLAINLDRASEEVGVYPIVLVSYLIACNEYTEGAPVDLVKAYLSYVISEEGQALAAEAAGSAPISADLRAEAQGFIDAIQ